MEDRAASSDSHLAPSVLFILLSLAGGRLTQLQLHQRLAEYSPELARLKEWTLAERIKSLVDREWIVASPERISPQDNNWTTYYRLRPGGKHALREELERLERLIALGKDKLRFAESQLHQLPIVTVTSTLPRGYRERYVQREHERRARLLKRKTMSLTQAAAALNLYNKAIAKMLADGTLQGTVSPTKSGTGRRWSITGASVRLVMRQQSAKGSTASNESSTEEPPTGPPVLSVTEAAHYLGVARTTILNWIENGLLEPANVGPASRGEKKVTLTSLKKALKSAKLSQVRRRSAQELQ
jgi:excisionase family DNA binding protein